MHLKKNQIYLIIIFIYDYAIFCKKLLKKCINI